MLDYNMATNPYGLMAIIVVYVVIVSFVASNYVQLKYAAFLLIVSAAYQSRCCLADWHGCQAALRYHVTPMLPGSNAGPVPVSRSVECSRAAVQQGCCVLVERGTCCRSRLMLLCSASTPAKKVARPNTTQPGWWTTLLVW